MMTLFVAVLIALLTWWVSTGIILALDGMPRSTYSRSMSAATAVLALALAGLAHVRDDVTAAGAYVSFGCGIAVWGWVEMSFLMGYLTGPRKQACSNGCRGWRRFGQALQVILYHEIALLVLGLTVFGLSWHGGNRLAAWTVALLWVMRASAKLNLFLGVRNPGTELLPPDLAYLGSYFRRQPMNFLLPVSVTAGTVLTTVLVSRLLTPGLSDFDTVSLSLLTTLSVLGVLEHWILVMPFSPTALWNWTMRSRQRAAQLRVI